MNFRIGLILAICSASISTFGWAQTPESSPLRDASGPQVMASMYLGQSYKAGEGSPGTAFLGAVEGGYTLAISPWNRLDIGFELGTGMLSFEARGADYDVRLGYTAMARAGYGYAMGEKMMAVLRLGAGMASGKMEGKRGAAKTVSESVDGFAGAVGWDVLLALADAWRLQAGLDMRIFNLKGSTTESYQISAPAVHLGLIHTL